MEMKFMRSIQFFLVSLIVNLTDVSDVIGSHEPVKATVGQDVVLPCHLDPPFDVSTLTVEWKQGAKQVHLYRSGADYLFGQDKNYKDRTSLFHEEMTRGNISLKLTNVTEQDAGKYSCFVPNLHSQVRKDNVTLTVEPGDNRRNGSQSDNTLPGERKTSAGLGTGAVIGILLSVGAVVGVVVGIVVFAWKKRRNSKKNAGDNRRRPGDDNQEGDIHELNYLRGNADN